MSKTKISIVILVLLFISIIDVKGNYNNKEIRIGLKEFHEGVNSIKINNNSISIIENKEIVHIFSSSNGFVFKPTARYYLLKSENYSTYESAKNKVDSLKDRGQNAYVGYSGNWKVLVGDANTVIELANLYNVIRAIDNEAYEQVSDNGKRITMEMGNEVVIFESTIKIASNNLINNTNIIDLGNRKYRGIIEIGRYKRQGVSAINILNLEEYLYSVVPSEVVPSWPIEALKAQAIASRNYTIYYSDILKKYPNEEYDLCDTVTSQAYKGYDIENSNTTRAVEETSGLMMYYGNNIIPAYYFSTSGGHTEDSENVWITKLPFLRGISDIYEKNPARAPWIIRYNKNDLTSRLTSYGVDVGNIDEIEIIEKTDSDRAMRVKIKGSKGEQIITKENIRTWLGLYSRKFVVVTSSNNGRNLIRTINSNNDLSTLKDTYIVSGKNSSPEKFEKNQIIYTNNNNFFTIPLISTTENEIVFVGQGWGHGVGMSQSGANGMAREGYKYEEILKHYFQNISIK